MSCLKMYNFHPRVKGLTLPGGFSLVRYTDERQIADWLDVCRDGLIGPDEGPEKFRRELVELDGPDPYRDTWFIRDDATGALMATFTAVPDMWSTGMGYIHMVAVRHEYRGRGFGSFIADYCLQILTGLGKDRVFLLTGEGRPAAIATYLKAGFLPVNYIDENRFDMVDRWQGVVNRLGLASLDLLNDDGTPFRTLHRERIFDVTDFGAAGDGVTDDRAAIQRAIDEAAAGGGVVELTAGKTYLSGGLVLRSHVHLHFGDGAVLLQNPDPGGYVRPEGDDLIPYRPETGHNRYADVKWSHQWYYNYPLVFAGEGTHDIRVSGHGTVKMMDDSVPDAILKICPVGFYRVSGFTVSDLEITNYHSYAMMPFTCDHGLIKNLTIHNWSEGNGDGICMMNCRHVRVHGCRMNTGDDSLYIFSSYRDPRGGAWWSSDEPQPSEHIEIDCNDLSSDHCKAFGMILWGIDCPDPEQVEVRDVWVHDNHFQTLGNWLYNPYTTRTDDPPVTDVRFENNVIEAIEPNFFETQVSDMTGFHAMRAVHNGDFAGGRVFWGMCANANAASVGVGHGDGGCENGAYGYLDHLDEGDAALYQGLFIRAGEPCCLWARVRTNGGQCRLFVRDRESGELIASQPFKNTEWQAVSLAFTVPRDANYRVGVERGEAADGWARIDQMRLLGNCDAAFGYARVGMDPQRDWKPLYFYNPDLWKTES